MTQTATDDPRPYTIVATSITENAVTELRLSDTAWTMVTFRRRLDGEWYLRDSMILILPVVP